MELTLTFANQGHNAIPIDYQYYLSSWMYRIIHAGDETYADFLHNQGYSAVDKKNKIFKLFCFSNLIIPQYKRDNDKIIIQSDVFYAKVRFKVDTAIESFIKGLFVGQTLELKTGFNTMTKFDVISVETALPAVQSNEYKLRTMSPLVVSRKQGSSETYLSPNDDGYDQYFFQNLQDKYTASGGTFSPQWSTMELSIKPTNPDKVRAKLIAITKPGREPIKVKGYTYDYVIKAPAPLIEIGLLAGFGKENAMGFGFCEVVG